MKAFIFAATDHVSNNADLAWGILAVVLVWIVAIALARSARRHAERRSAMRLATAAAIVAGFIWWTKNRKKPEQKEDPNVYTLK